MGWIKNYTVKTRKPHSCFGCADEHPKGTNMEIIVWAEDGYISKNYWCDVCRAFWDKNMDADDTIDPGDLKREYPDEWEAMKQKVEGKR